MPPRVNKKMLLIILGAVLVSVLGITIVMVAWKGLGNLFVDPVAQRAAQMKKADDYRAKGEYDKEIFTLRHYVNGHPSDIAVRLRLARTLEERGHLGEALEEYKNIVRDDPANVDARLKVAKYSGDAGQWGVMAQRSKEVLEREPRNAQARLYLAQASLATNQLPEALENAKAARDADPKNVDAYLVLARVYERMRQSTEARKVIEEALKVAPDNQDLHSYLAMQYLAAGEKDKAKAEFEKALACAKDRVRAHVELGAFYISQKDWLAAEKQYKAGTDNTTAQMDKLRAYTAYGDFLAMRNRPDEALKQYDEALVALPKAPGVLLKKAEIYLNTNKPDEAARVLEDIKSRARRDEFYARALYLNGYRLLQAGKSQDAVDELSRALKEVIDLELNVPNPADIHRALAQAYESQRNWKAAKAEIDAALRLKPSNLWPLIYNKAVLCYALREFDEGVKLLASVGNRPYEGDLLLARMLAALGNFKDARTQYLACVKAKPDDASAHFELGRLEYVMKQYDEALKHLDEAISRNAKLLDAVLIKAKVYEAQKLPAKAEQVYKALATENKGNDQLRLEYAFFLSRQNRLPDAERLLVDAIVATPQRKHDLEEQLWRFYLAIGKTDDAVERLKEQAKNDPKDIEARQNIVLLDLMRNKPDEATKYLDEIKTVEPGSARVLRLEGQILVAKRQFKDALERLLKAEQLAPGDADAQYYLGVSYLRTGQPALAKKYMELVFQRYDNARVRRALAEIYYTLGEWAKAHEQSTRLLRMGETGDALDIINAQSATMTGDPAEGEASWRSIVKKNPDFPDAHLGLGDSLLKQGKKTEAYDAYKKAYELDKKSFRTTLPIVNILLADKKADEALAVVKDALVEHKDDVSLLALQGRLLEIAGKPDEAIRVYARVRELDPSNPLPLLAGADAAASRGDWAAAETGYRSALKLNPDNRQVFAKLIEVMVRQGKTGPAMALIDAELRAIPEAQVTKRCDDVILLTWMKSNVRRIEGNLNEAVQFMNRAIKVARDAGLQKEKDNTRLHFELAILYRDMGRLGEAQKEFEAAKELQPDLTEARLNLVQLALAQGRTEEARAECLEIVTPPQGKPDLNAYVILGDISRGEKDDKRARDYYDKAAREFPKSAVPHRRLASLLIDEDKTDAAIAELKKVLELEAYTPRSLVELSDLLVRMKKPDQAIAFCNDAVTKGADAVAAYMCMGDVEYSRRQFAKARSYYDMAIKKKPDEPACYLGRGRTFLAEKDTVKALDEARRALGVSDKFEGAWVFIENVLRSESKNAEVEKHYRDWARALPDSVILANNEAWYLIEVKKDADGALRIIDKFRSRVAQGNRDFPMSADLCDTEGWAQYVKGNYRQAVDLFKESIAKRPDAPEVVPTLEHWRLADLKLLEQARRQNDLTAASRLEQEIQKVFEISRRRSPFDPVMQMQLGDAKFAEGNIPEAIKCYEQVLQVKPDYDDARRKLAEILIRDNRLEQAKKRVDELIKTDPKEPRNIILQSMLLSQSGKRADAIKLLEDLVVKSPDTVMAHYVLAGEYLASNQVDKGIAELNTTIQKAPQFSQARLLRAQVSAAQGKWDDAVAETRTILKNEPANFDAAGFLGNLYLAQKKFGEAETQFKGMTQKWPDSIVAHARLAETYRLSNRLGQALIEYRTARRLDEDSLFLLRGEAGVLQADGKFDRAVQEYDDYLKKNAQTLDAWADLARLYESAGRTSDAERTYKALVSHGRTILDAHRVLLDYYMRRGMFVEARSAARQMESDVGTSQAKAIARVCVAQTYEADGKFDEAMREYRQALTDDPKNAAAANNLAWLLISKQNKVDEAIKIAEPLMKDNPNFPELWDTVGWAYRLKNKPDKAEPMLERAFQLMNMAQQLNPTMAFHYAEVLYLNGKVDKSKQILKQLEKVKFPESDKVKEILGKIK